jgi:ribose-phosphate pyrophosphokinase
MIILNLAYPENISEVEFKVSKFPDGQQTIDLLEWSSIGKYTDPVMIKSRLNSFRDLELIICATQAVRNIQPNKEIQLYVPYFLGSRSDRKFVEGGVNYLKQVICPIINSQNYSKVITVDSHSDVLEACLNNYEKISNVKLAKWALSNIDNKNGAQDRTMIVSPDAGALKKIYDIAKTFRIKNVVTAGKVRDIVTGNIVKTELPQMNLDGIEQIVIFDDICDGGRTFIELAKVIKEQTDKPIYLVVTHGIFSAGLLELSKHFNGVYSTNSVKDINVEEYSDFTVNKDFLKQQNIF